MQEGWDVSSSDSHPCWAVIRCMTGFQTIIIINDRYDHVVEDEDPYDYQFPYGRHHRCRIKNKTARDDLIKQRHTTFWYVNHRNDINLRQELKSISAISLSQQLL